MTEQRPTMIIHDSLMASLKECGLAIVPIELTPAIACALEECGPPESQSSAALVQLVEDYKAVWAHVLAAAHGT